MAKHKVRKAVTREPTSRPKSISFFKRFAMVFESLSIVLITAVLIWSTRFVDVPEFVMKLSSSQQHWKLGDVIAKE